MDGVAVRLLHGGPWAEKNGMILEESIGISTKSDAFFLTCQVRVVRFYVRCAGPPSSFFLLLPPSSPDLICQLLIAVSLAGSHLPALDSSGPRRTSTGESLSAVDLAGLQPARV